MRLARWAMAVGLACLLGVPAGCSAPSGLVPLVVKEQRTLDIREPSEIPQAPFPKLPPPATVSNPAPAGTSKELSLDEALRIALASSKVIRTLAGTDVVSSGRTIYDPAIANTGIDAAKSVFDPVITAQNAFSRTDMPPAIFDPTNPTGARILGNQIDNYALGLGMTKKLVSGATVGLNETLNVFRFPAGSEALNPQSQSALALTVTQPLLQGAGVSVNVAPILIARLQTERSYFQLKDSVQDLVRGVIQAYWSVVFARTDVWAKRQQVEQGAAAHARAEARKKAGLGSTGDVAQAQVALSNFRAALVTAEATLLQNEDILRNILGWPPTEPERIVPVTPPSAIRIDPKWDEILALASEMRPDLIELNLVLEADEQNLRVARNQTLPKLDAAMSYQWNGLEGIAPSGDRLSVSSGPFANWSLGVNFSVPLGLRQGRANLRNAELVLVSDKANLEQARHHALHALAGNLRNLAQYYEQYIAFRETRSAARVNLEQQIADFRAGRSILLNVLQAITDWGNAVSSEAQSLAQYNVELANLEEQTGTILESHGVRFMEERFASIGPLGRLAKRRLYPLGSAPGPNAERYPDSGGPPDKDLDNDRPSLNEPPPKQPPAAQQVPLQNTQPRSRMAATLGAPRIDLSSPVKENEFK
jgi:outer membrane protein TolC